MAEVQLLGSWGSAYSRRIEMALKLKGIEYEYIEQDLANKSPLLLQYNPVHKKIPVLVHNGKPIAESVVILEYLDETWKANPILPSDPYDRAMARFWANFLDGKCDAAIRKAIWSRGEEREKAIEEVHDNFKMLENELRGKKFFGGETIGFVDIVANYVGFWLEIFQEAAEIEFVTKDNFPILCNWMDEFVNHRVVKECLPTRNELIAFLKPRFAAASWKY